jgi:hypothetical protein
MNANEDQQDTGNETLQKVPTSDNSDVKFWLSEPDKIEDGDGDWEFSIFADKDVFLATISYVTQAGAMRGRIAMAEALKEAIVMATSQS